MSEKQKLPPHVATHDGEQGAHDVPVKLRGDSSKKGNHSGRAHPPKESAGGDDYAAGAENGGVLKQ
jgi:hypothetical protein